MTAAMVISGTIGWLVMVSGQPVLEVVFWRCVFGALALWLIGWRMGLLRLRGAGLPALSLAAASGLAIVGNWLLLFAAYSRASIGVATAVYNTQPFMLVALGALFLGERITRDKVLWLVLAFAGMLAITQAHDTPVYGQAGGYLAGIGLSLAAAFLYALAALWVKQLTLTPHLIALIQVCVGIAMLAPFAHPAALAVQPLSAWASLLVLGVVNTGVMYVLLYGGIQKLPTALTGALSFIYPVVAILVDWAAFGHRLQWPQWIGVAAILAAAAGMRLGWSWPARGRGRPPRL